MARPISRRRPSPSFAGMRELLWRTDEALAVALADAIFAAKNLTAQGRITAGTMSLVMKLEVCARSCCPRGNRAWEWTGRERGRIAKDMYAAVSPMNAFKDRIVFRCGYRLEETALNLHPRHEQVIIRISHHEPNEWLKELSRYTAFLKMPMAKRDKDLSFRRFMSCDALCRAVKAYSTVIED